MNWQKVGQIKQTGCHNIETSAFPQIAVRLVSTCPFRAKSSIIHLSPSKVRRFSRPGCSPLQAPWLYLFFYFFNFHTFTGNSLKKKEQLMCENIFASRCKLHRYTILFTKTCQVCIAENDIVSKVSGRVRAQTQQLVKVRTWKQFIQWKWDRRNKI